MTGQSIRLGVIGAGGIASRHIGNAVEFEDVRLVGVADPVLERAEGQAARGAATAYSDWRAMLDAESPDAVLICVPPFAHGEPELGLIERGLPFFVEKPVAVDLEIAERIGAAVASAGLVTGVGYHWRYLDTVEQARELLAERPARLALGYWWDSTPPPAWWRVEAMSGGQMVEQTTHIFDVARHLIGDAASVTAEALLVPRDEFPDADVAAVSAALVRFESGAIGSFTSSGILRWPHRVGLHLVSEGMVLELGEHELMVDVGRGRPLTHPTRDPFKAELRDFLDAASGGENRVRVPFAEALETHRLAVAASRSAREGRTINVNERTRVGSAS